MSDLKFDGNIVEAIETVKEIVERVRAGEGPSKHVVDHILYAAGQFHTLRPDDVTLIGFNQDCNCDDCEDCCKQLEDCCPELVDGKIPAEGSIDYLKLMELLYELYTLLKDINK